jgi:hypothetical protein
LGDVVEKKTELDTVLCSQVSMTLTVGLWFAWQDYSAVKGWADSSSFFKVSESRTKKYRKARVKSGDLLITIVGNWLVGSCARFTWRGKYYSNYWKNCW